MARPPKGDKKLEYKTLVRLPAEWAVEMTRASNETSVPPAVLARQWVIERLREMKEKRQETERGKGHE